jgi:hypothetical protein
MEIDPTGGAFGLFDFFQFGIFSTDARQLIGDCCKPGWIVRNRRAITGGICMVLLREGHITPLNCRPW